MTSTAEKYLKILELQVQKPDLKFLNLLQYKHRQSIPIHNFSISKSKKEPFELSYIFKKVVLQNQGGDPFQLNAIFQVLLSEIGFDAHLITVESTQNTKSMAIKVHVNDRDYFVDVGNIYSPSKPFEIEEKSFLSNLHYFTLVKDVNDIFSLNRSRDGSDFQTLYVFSREHKKFIQYFDTYDQCTEKLKFMHMEPESAYIETTHGYIFLSEKQLLINEKGEIRKYDLLNEEDKLAKLEQHFGVSIEEDIG